jgi:uncharacterized membrane protein
MTTPSRIEIAPHCSLTPRGAALFFGGTCAVSFTVAGLVAAQGFWPVLPFAGLEMALLGWALKTSMDRRHHRQTITVSEDSVEVEYARPPHSSRVVFPRHWAQVRIDAGSSRLHPTRLLIESHGRGCEIGGFLNEQERQGLARRLKRLIGRVNESPLLQQLPGSA